MSIDKSGQQRLGGWCLVIVLMLVLIITSILLGTMGCVGNVAAIN